MSKLSLLPVYRDLLVSRDADVRLQVEATDSAGLAINLSTDTWTLYVLTALGGTSKFSISNAPGSHSDPTNGKTIFSIPRANLSTGDVSTTEPTLWRYEIRRTEQNGQQTPWFAGVFQIVPTK